jgi:predicted nucleic acid-binding protein
MARLIVVDSSPLIGLALGGVFDELEDLYGTLMITRLVKDEVAGRGDLPGALELNTAMRAGWIRVAPAPPETWQLTGLDAGEASTLALAAKRPDSLVIIDDLVGRERAAELKIDTLDTAGVLLAMHEAGLVPQLKPVVARLVRRGFTLPETALQALAAASPDIRASNAR